MAHTFSNRQWNNPGCSPERCFCLGTTTSASVKGTQTRDRGPGISGEDIEKSFSLIPGHTTNGHQLMGLVRRDRRIVVARVLPLGDSL